MDTVTYPDPEVRKELSRWAVAKINVAERPEVARAFGVPAVPTAVCVDPSGAVLAKLPDFISPETFEKRLHDIRNAR